MPPINPAQTLLDAPLGDIVVLLLKQFKRLLEEQQLALPTAEIERIGQAVVAYAPLPTTSATLPTALWQLVQASLTVLQTQFQLDFATALHTEMSAIGGWTTTADFLELANQKSNAELRISGGTTLLILLGDARAAPYVLQVVAADRGAEDVDALLARRALCHAARVDVHAADWLAQVQAKFAAE
jgi:hypothetical protein